MLSSGRIKVGCHFVEKNGRPPNPGAFAGGICGWHVGMGLEEAAP